MNYREALFMVGGILSIVGFVQPFPFRFVGASMTLGALGLWIVGATTV